MDDYISRADAIEAVGGVVIDEFDVSPTLGYEVAEKALSALPSAELPKGDLISRRWLLDLYGDYIGDNGDTKYHVPLEVVRQNIIDAPPADAVQGEWIEVEDDYDNIYWECSNCEDAFVLEVGTPKDNNYNFCPSCGARMYREDGEA